MKVILTIIAFVIAIPIFAMVKEGGAIKLIFLAGLIAGVRAIWKYESEGEKKDIPDKDKHQLDKTE